MYTHPAACFLTSFEAILPPVCLALGYVDSPVGHGNAWFAKDKVVCVLSIPCCWNCDGHWSFEAWQCGLWRTQLQHPISWYRLIWVWCIYDRRQRWLLFVLKSENVKLNVNSCSKMTLNSVTCYRAITRKALIRCHPYNVQRQTNIRLVVFSVITSWYNAFSVIYFASMVSRCRTQWRGLRTSLAFCLLFVLHIELGEKRKTTMQSSWKSCHDDRLLMWL